MQIKKIVEILLISIGILALSACSHTKKNDPNAGNGAYDANGNTVASGAGNGSNYGDENNSKHLVSKRTYYFDFDRSEIRDADKPAIYANADYLMAHPNSKIIILEGHTDPRGSREYNVGLGERRANAVADLLKSKGVSPKQIRIVSYGSEKRAGSGHTESEYQVDRRAVITHLQG